MTGLAHDAGDPSFSQDTDGGDGFDGDKGGGKDKAAGKGKKTHPTGWFERCAGLAVAIEDNDMEKAQSLVVQYLDKYPKLSAAMERHRRRGW